MNACVDLVGGVVPMRIREIHDRETKVFSQMRPKTKAALDGGTNAFVDGVPMLWMLDWPQPFPMLVAEARGAHLTDIDGHQLDDFCLGDTGSMFGHSPAPVVAAIERQAGVHQRTSEDASQERHLTLLL